MEKHNARIPPDVKILASTIEGPTRQHDNPVLTEDAESIIKFITSGGIEGPTGQHDNPVLTEDNKYIINFINSGVSKTLPTNPLIQSFRKTISI